MEIKVNLKSIGKRKPAVKPELYQIQGCPASVRELICAVTESGVRAFHKKAQSAELLSCLTKDEIEAGAQAGKVSFGSIYGETETDIIKAQENAVQCFEDGIYRIFMDDRQLETLDEAVCVTEDSEFTFVRLTMLAGRMW